MDLGPLALIVLGLAVTWVCLIGLLWLKRPRDASLRELVGVVPDVLRLIGGLARDPSVPLRVRGAVIGLAAWLLSPIDLVPDLIPVLGLVDDVVVAILVLRYVRRHLGAAEFQRRWPGSSESLELLEPLLR